MIEINFLSIIGVALLSGFSHCIGMCGGFASLCYASTADTSRTKSFFLAFIYNLSRIFSYVILGAIFGAFGGIFVLSGANRSLLYFCIGILLVFIGVALFFRGEMLKFLENQRLSKHISNLMSKANSLPRSKKFIVFGLLNGLLPCGVVYYFLAQSIASASSLVGASIMLVFGLCTLPAMMGLNLFYNVLGVKFKQIMFHLCVIVIIANGLYLAYLGYMANG
ncbi:MAG: sulfite exporter TauE/SafE family protein [Campylobacter sp.]|nr:sulfite exporter TauE/SafE family protein [Campylobacter sp.]